MSKTLIPLPVIIYPTATNLFSYIIKYLYTCYYSVVKPEPQFTGTFMEFGSFVWIHNQTSISQLYKLGFFGKGDLSRSEPTWLIRNIQQNKDSLEEITVERRRKRRNQKSTTHNNFLKPDEILTLTDSKNIETFQLDLYEAFFLVFALNSLRITSPNQKSLTIGDCWSMFNKCNPSFNINYAVYHYYRSLGWVPKSGSKFGVDFVLYQSGPSFRHADYAVTIIPLYQDKIEKAKNWDWLLRLNRICTQVKKTLILCYVNIPHETTCYSNLNEYTIRQVEYKRWSPQKNRE